MTARGAAIRVYTAYAPLAASVRAGQELLLDDGRIVLRVDGTDGKVIDTTVVHGSQLGEHKGINAPGVRLPSAGLTAKDAADLRFGLSNGVDMVALSFVQNAADVEIARAAIEAAGATGTPIVAKLERPEAIAQLDEILARADARDGRPRRSRARGASGARAATAEGDYPPRPGPRAAR